MTHEPIYLPSIFAQMGDWTYFATVMTFADLSERVQYADEVNQVRVNRELSDLIQRSLNGPRSDLISQYLTTHDDRFFNSLVVAVYGGEPTWLELGIDASLNAEGLNAVPEWTRSAFGFLHLSGEEKLFALDGQHRLAGIKKAITQNTELGSEKISVIFVSHRADEAGRKRTRRLFITLNKTAVKVGKSDIIALDESDTYAIITRRLVETHPYFSRGQVRIKYGQANLSSEDSTHFTTIIKLYDYVCTILGNIVTGSDRDARLEMKYVRPSDADLNKYYQRTARFFELLVSEIPELSAYFTANGDAAREILARERHTNKNILFRSVGLEVLLRVIRKLKGITGNWEDAVRVAATVPRRFTDVPYRNVIYSMSEQKIIAGRVVLTANLLLYMLRAEEQTAQLKQKYAEALGTPVDDTRLPRRLPVSPLLS
ncbi:DGQHR domain-containing protein [Methylobacterium sp. A52T]